MNRPFKKPLIIMTPKSLLRDKNAVSMAEEMATGTHFQELIDDPAVSEKDAKKIERLIFCSGKVYYDLVAYRAAQEIKNSAIIRVEQLYPWNGDLAAQIMARYTAKETKVVWCQEEPLNMGAWSYVYHRLSKLTDHTVRYAGRDSAASPAVGSKTWHDAQQADLVAKAYEI
jgi:2-oxoglutarate dehydrogenase E1 component